MEFDIFGYHFVFATDWPIFALLMVFLILIIFAICYVIYYKRTTKTLESLKSGKSNTRFYTIYYNENKVYVVDKHIMKDKRFITLEEFYRSISDDEYIKVKMWLTELIYKDKLMQDSLDVTVKLKSDKTPIFGVLSCTSIDYNTNIAHVECKLFPEYKKRLQSNVSTEKVFELSDKELQDYFENTQRNLTSMYVIRLYSEESRGHPSTFRARTILMRLIISNLQSHLTGNKRLTLTPTNELIILDPTSGYKNDIIAFCHIIIENIQKVLFQSSVQDDYKFIIGICFDRFKKYNYQDLYKYAKEVSIYAQKRGQEPFLFYDENQDYTKDTYQETLNALKSTIDNKAISVRYTTIYNLSAKTEGYTCEFLPDNSVLPSISEIFDIADENKLNLELYSLLYEKVNAAYTVKYFPTKEKRRFIIKFKLKNYKTILSVPNIYPVPENVKTIFTLTDDDLSETASNNSKFLQEAIKALKADDRIRLGLQFKSTSIDISDDILDYFDYFIFNQKDDFPDLLKKAQNQILMQNLISTLKEHPLGKLTGINLENFDNIEYFINLGFRYVASPYFGSLVNGLPTNDIKKLSRMTALKKTKKGSK